MIIFNLKGFIRFLNADNKLPEIRIPRVWLGWLKEVGISFSDASFNWIFIGTLTFWEKSEVATKTVFLAVLFKVSIVEGNLNHKFEIPFQRDF